MSFRTTGEQPRRGRAATLVGGAVAVVVALAALCQLWHPPRAIGHDTWTLLPVRDWRFGSGEWDGVDPRTHQGIGGGIYDYGFVERMTNTR